MSRVSETPATAFLEVSTKNLARQLGRKRVEPCAPDVAERHSGYQVGGTSPFGLRKLPPVLRRGFLVALAPAELMRITNATPVDVALER